MTFNKLFKSKKPLIGMIHLPPLPGYPTYPGMNKVIEKALTDLKTLEKAGFDGVLVENDNDQPHQIEVNKEIKQAFKQVMKVVVSQSQIPVGMEIIYDMVGTIKMAHEVNAQFVRLDVFVDNVQTKWGKIFAQAKEIKSLKKQLNANNLLLLTDIQVKHAQMLDKKNLEESALEAIKWGSNAIIITGDWTGQAPILSECLKIKKIVKNFPVLIGSGLTTTNINEFLQIVDGGIVGTSIKSGEYINFKKAKRLIKKTNIHKSVKIPHFYKAKSRIGLVNPPIHHTQLNIGVEDGPDHILNKDFLSIFSQFKLSDYSFPKPESIKSLKFNQVLFNSINEFKDLINKSLKKGETQVVIGGDHSVSLPSVLALIERIDDAKVVGYIHFDSHGDINLSKDSPTNNFHGMYLRVLFDDFDIPLLDELVFQKLPTENLLIIGNLDLDQGEKLFIKQQKIKQISKEDLEDRNTIALKKVKKFINTFEYIHLSFDIDCLDKTIAPATGIPANNGLILKQILPILEIIKSHPQVSIDLVEVNPRKKGIQKTILTSQEILKSLLCYD